MDDEQPIFCYIPLNIKKGATIARGMYSTSPSTEEGTYPHNIQRIEGENDYPNRTSPVIALEPSKGNI